MHATTWFHDGVPNPVLQEADWVFHESIAVHSTDGLFDPDADRCAPTIGRLFRRREGPATRWWLRLNNRDAMQEESLEALLLIQATAGWPGLTCQLCHALIRRVPFTGVAPDAHVPGRSDHEAGVARVTRRDVTDASLCSHATETSPRALLALPGWDAGAPRSGCRAACRPLWVRDRCQTYGSGGSCRVAHHWCGPADRLPTRARKEAAAP
jgi:hypothetical protein